MKRIWMMLGLTAILAGCGGGGGSSSSAVPQSSDSATPAPGSSTGPMAQTRVTISIPAITSSSSTKRQPRYVSSATNSLSIQTSAGTAVVNVGSSSPSCASGANGRDCTIQVELPSGSNVPFIAQTFASTDGSGTPLSIAAATTTIVPGQTNTLNLTLNAVVSAVSVALGSSTFATRQAATTTVTTTVYDAANQIIVVGSNNLVDQNDSPVTVTLADSDTSGVTSVSPTTVGATPSTLAYNGGTPPAGATVSATARNAANAIVATASAAFAFGAQPNPTPTPTASPTPLPSIVASPNSLSFLSAGAAAAQTVGLSQGSYGGAFSAVTSTGNTSAVTLSISGNTLTVTPQQSGATTIVITGAAGSTLTIPVGVTLTQLTVSGHR